MNKNVLILSASPRKGGNSDVLCDEFLKGAVESGNSAVKIFLESKNINYCTGCGACYAKGKKCVQKDDMAEILEKMIKSDVIVMASPVYFYTMNAQMKTLIDRTCSDYERISNKEFYFIITAADSLIYNLERTVEGFRGFTSCLDGAEEKGIIYGTGVWSIGEVNDTGIIQEAYEMGKSI